MSDKTIRYSELSKKATRALKVHRDSCDKMVEYRKYYEKAIKEHTAANRKLVQLLVEEGNLTANESKTCTRWTDHVGAEELVYHEPKQEAKDEK